MYFEIVNLYRTAQAMKLWEFYIGDHVASRMAIQRNETIPKWTTITEYKFILRFIQPSAFHRNDFFLKIIINTYFCKSCIIVDRLSEYEFCTLLIWLWILKFMQITQNRTDNFTTVWSLIITFCTLLVLICFCTFPRLPVKQLSSKHLFCLSFLFFLQ